MKMINPSFCSTLFVTALFSVIVSPSAVKAATCPSSPPVNAENLLNMKDFGAVPDQGSALDIAPLLNCALSFARSHKLRTIYFAYGTYTFNRPVQEIDFPITITGDGKSRTYLARNYNASSPSEGFLTFVGASPGSFFVGGAAGSSVRDLAIIAAASSSHGSAISLIANQSTAPDFSLFSDLYLSRVSSGSWDYTVYIDGRARTAAPIGVRDVEFQNCAVFGAANGAMLLEGVESFTFIGGAVLQAGGDGKILISPSYKGPHVCDLGPYTPESGLPSFYMNINTSFAFGILMQASCYGHFSVAYSGASITTSSFSSDNIVIGHVDGGVEPFWRKSKYIDPEN